MSHDEDLSGEMGVSSEREGPTGPGQFGTHGTVDTGPPATPGHEPEQRSAAQEADAEGTVAADDPEGTDDVRPDAPIPPVAGYNSHDPRAEKDPYVPRGPSSTSSA